MSYFPDELFELLPAYYRLADARQGQALQALLRLVARQAEMLQEDIDQLYDDQFIETCQPWVAPYLGDLVGYELLHGVSSTWRAPRAEVANTIASRRKKGTLAGLEPLARDVANWRARAVELADLVLKAASIRFLDDPRKIVGLPSVRDLNALDALKRHTAFDQMSRLLDVRRPDSTLTTGRVSLTGVALYVHRLSAFPLIQVLARRVVDRGFTLDPLGRDVPLFIHSRPRPELDPEQSEPPNGLFDLPAELSPLLFPSQPPIDADNPSPAEQESLNRLMSIYDEAFTKSLALWIEVAPQKPYLRRHRHHHSGSQTPLDPNAQRVFIQPEQLIAADLRDWETRPATFPPEGCVAIDPALGRVMLAQDLDSRGQARLIASFYYGAPDAIGAGGHPWKPLPAPEIDNLEPVVVSTFKEINEYATSLDDYLQLVASWDKQRGRVSAKSPPTRSMPRHVRLDLGARDEDHNPHGEFLIARRFDNYDPDTHTLTWAIPADCTFHLRASQVSSGGDDFSTSPILRPRSTRKPLTIAVYLQPGQRPSEPELPGAAAPAVPPVVPPARLVLEGLTLSGLTLDLRGWPPPPAGEVSEPPQPSVGLELIPPEVLLDHTTLMPQPAHSGESIDIPPTSAGQASDPEESHSHSKEDESEARENEGEPPGPCLRSSRTPLRLEIAHSVVGPMQFDRGGLIGAPVCLEVRDSILDAGGSDSPLITDPRHCVAPVVATIRRATVRGKVHLHALDLGENSIFLGQLEVVRRQVGEVRYCYIAPVAGSRTPRRTECQPPQQSGPSDTSASRVRPVFTSLKFGKPGYFQLAMETPAQILAGASDEAEMGAFHDLFQGQRAARLAHGSWTPSPPISPLS